MTQEDRSGSREAMADARARMVEGLRREIRGERVLRAFAEVPRERFVPAEFQAYAYEDRPLAIGHGQTISQPMMVALMLQEMALSGEEKVLDVGTGSGYQAALLSRMAKQVVGVELVPELAESARSALLGVGYGNVSVHAARDELGWPDEAPYNAIVVAAASPRVPQSLVAQLAPGGRLVLPVGPRERQDLVVIVSTPEGLEVTRKGACGFVPLIGREAFSPQ